MSNTPVVGDTINAVYVENGKVTKALKLGAVTKINKKKKTFTDSNGTERGYSFAVSNGVKLLGFTKPLKEDPAESTEDSTEDNGD